MFQLYRMLTSTKHLILIVGVMASALILVSILAWSALKPINIKNGFNRNIKPNFINAVNSSEKDKEITDIIGATENTIYLRTKSPGRILMTNYRFNTKKNILLNIDSAKKTSSFYYTIVDSPQVSVLAGNIPCLYVSTLDSGKKTNSFRTPLFTRAVMISPSTYAFRGFDSTIKTPDQIFMAKNFNTGEIKKENNLSERNSDAGISTDGILNFDSASNLITYVFFYKNQFLCLDTNLNLIRRCTTVDTTNLLNLKTQSLVNSKKEVSYTNASPKRLINSVSCVDNGYLYNNSHLKADNETDETFQRNSIIDVYDLKNSKYLYSFYIPHYKKENMENFKIIKNKLIVLYKTQMIYYNVAK